MLERRLTQLRILDPRDHYDGRVRPPAAKLLEQPITRLIRQAHVEQRKGVVGGFETLPGARRGEGDVRFKATAAQRPLHDLGQQLLVIHYEEALPVYRQVHALQCREAQLETR